MDNDFQINQDGKLSLEYDDFQIKEYTVGEIMARNNVRPFFIFAQSNSGKTVIGTNCVLECVAKKYSQVIYITQSYNVSNNIFLRNNVLKQFVFDPTKFKKSEQKIEFVKFLIKLQQTLEQIGEQNKDYSESVKKYIQQLQQDMIRTSELDYCQKIKNDNPYVELLSTVFQDKHLQADQIFKQIYSQNTLIDFFNKVEGSLVQLQSLFQTTQNLKIMYSGAEMAKSFAFAYWRNKIRDDYQKYKNIIQQKYKDIIIQNYNELKRDHPDEVQLFMQNQTDYPTNGNQLKQKVKDICQAIQSEPRFCVIFDDVSDTLQAMLKETKIKYQGRTIQNHTNEFLQFMITRGRHYGTFLCAVHGANFIPSEVRSQIGNVIIPPATLDQFVRQTACGQQDKIQIKAIASMLGDYNQEHGTHYVLVYFQNTDESVDGCKFAFMQADYNEKDEFNIAAYKANPYFYYFAQHQNDREESEDDYDYSYSSDEQS